jgi:hypothetical protein
VGQFILPGNVADLSKLGARPAALKLPKKTTNHINMTTNAPRKRGTTRPKAFSLLSVAKIYSVGVSAGLWTTQAAAAELLQVSASELSRAVNIASLPDEILGLFSSPEAITEDGAKRLRKILANDGLSEMLVRASRLAASAHDKRASNVLAALSGRDFVAASEASKRPQLKLMKTGQLHPLDVAKEFNEGMARGEWTTRARCALSLGLKQDLVSWAVRIDALPAEVKALFFLEGSMTFAAGKQLLEIKRELGLTPMIATARRIDGCSGTRSSQNVLDELRGKNVLPFDEINVRVTRGRGDKFLKIECSDPALFVKYRKEIQEVVRRLLFKRLRMKELGEIERELRSKIPGYGQFKRGT